MNEIIEIENVIPIDHQNYILDEVTGINFPWYYNPTLVSPDDEFAKNYGNISGFNHFLYEENKKVSNFFDLAYPVVLAISSQTGIKFNKLDRMRFNLTLQNKSAPTDWHLPHIDNFYEHYVAVYYVNDADGDTIIFNETNETYNSGQLDINAMLKNDFTIKQRVTPKKGKIVVFPGHYYHSSNFAREAKFRCVLNINLGKIF